jgi:hypothetical protein
LATLYNKPLYYICIWRKARFPPPIPIKVPFV